ncbi:hypothetical protein ACLB2K_001565 [Fragaria x ananassa]
MSIAHIVGLGLGGFSNRLDFDSSAGLRNKYSETERNQHSRRRRGRAFGVVKAVPSSSLRLRDRERSELRGVSNNASTSSSLRSRLSLRRHRGFGFVAVEASALSPSRHRLRRRRGIGFVAVV